MATWFAVIVSATGALVSFGTEVGPLSSGLVSVQLPHQPDFSVERWDPATKALAPLAPAQLPRDYPAGGRTLLTDAKAEWTGATSDWTAAAGMPEGTTAQSMAKALAELAAIRHGQVAILKGLRALGRVAALEDPLA